MPKFTILFEEDAKLDIADSFDWYSKISETIANNFLNETKGVVKYLENNPSQFKVIYKDFRQAPFKKYPFVILYRVDNTEVKIYRVFPTKKDPSKKIK